MMDYIKGILAESSPLKTVVETGGIGYRIHIPLSNYAKLPQVGEPICFFLSTVIREDSHKNYGFLTTAERDLFENLIEISGVGPKTALALLGHLEPSDLQIAISRSDITSICRVPGIGKKTAERLIVEMRDRVQKMTVIPHTTQVNKGVFQDALSALVNLGYPSAQVQKTLQALLKEEEDSSLTDLITSALKKL